MGITVWLVIFSVNRFPRLIGSNYPMSGVYCIPIYNNKLGHGINSYIWIFIYLDHLRVEEITRRLKVGDYGIPLNPEDR